MSMDQLETIAQDATFQVQCAMCQIDWLRGVLHVLEDRLKNAGDKHGANVANLAIYNADDWHNALDDQRETLEKRIESARSAPRNAVEPVRGATNSERLPLADFARGRQHEAARDLGVQQAAISKAIRVGRAVFVTRMADGSYSATEEKPFPSPRFGDTA
ncbi:Cro/CI family transcriptional regulator [Pseudomonas sp. VEM90]